VTQSSILITSLSSQPYRWEHSTQGGSVFMKKLGQFTLIIFSKMKMTKSIIDERNHILEPTNGF
ncbi:MAG: hypothetical protein M0P57_09190, partial [Syntrophales bacterium]|nr:hypothetical protein [Syntrophales bacterium]